MAPNASTYSYNHFCLEYSVKFIMKHAVWRMFFRFWLTSIQLVALILLLLHNSGDTFQSSFILLLSCWIYWNYWCSFQEFILQTLYRITKTFSLTCPIGFLLFNQETIICWFESFKFQGGPIQQIMKKKC